MAIPTNQCTIGITLDSPTENLSIAQDFVLSSNQKMLFIFNASSSETANVLLKGTKSEIELSQWGTENISDGLPITIAPMKLTTIILSEMYKHIGENGDVITVSTDSTEKEKVTCWLSE